MGSGMTPPNATPSGPWKPTDAEADLAAGINITPYVHWWKHRNLGARCGVEACHLPQIAALQVPAQTAYFQAQNTGAQTETVAAIDPKDAFGETVPLPAFAMAPPDSTPGIPTDLADRITKPARDTVITGIVDEGIALGHSRFRDAGGNSRVLAAWQQGARFGGPDGTAPAPVPFGHTLMQSEVNALFAAHTQDGWLDEDAFNIAAGLTDGSEPMGITTLDRTVAHGTHVLDLAAGFDAADQSADALNRRPILAVTLPRREAIGMAGTFLQFFVLHAMQWIVDMADALWQQHYPGEEGGFPVVINLSFGQHAGPKNGATQIEKAYRILASQRGTTCPLRLVMPVGNDNLERGNAYANFDPQIADPAPLMSLPLRVQPQDQSSNFVEFWVELEGTQPDQNHPLILDIDLPDGQKVEGIQGRHRHYIDLPRAARVYAEVFHRYDDADPASLRKTLYHYVVCLSPTQDEKGHNPVSPSGVWGLRVRWSPDGVLSDGQTPTRLYCTVQVDQAAEGGSLRNRRAYFDHAAYVTHDDNGRVRDTFRYPFHGLPEDVLDGTEPDDWVQRRGTHNAIATIPEIILVGGHRLSDGRPAPYSATTHAAGRTPYGAATQITGSFPTETAPSHPGLAAAGPRSAATVSLSGTSFAAGHATRQVVSALLAWQDANFALGVPDGTSQGFAARATQSELGGIYPEAASPLKIGHGRLPVEQMRRLDRLTWGA